MALSFSTLNDFAEHGHDSLIDVRSPAEFALDHIPGAISLPALSDAERARVGTIYTRRDPFSARKIGAALLARNVARHLTGPLADKDGGWRPLIYCWRGGQRSGAFASILTQIGWRTQTVTGGYQTYRRLISTAMYEHRLRHRLIVLEGDTGTAKTELLQLLAARGQQVVDLEGLAAHRGSVFGATSSPQPNQKAFEAALAWAFERCDARQPVLVEAESSKIGNLLIPPSVWKAMKDAPRLQVSAPLAARSAYLVRAYADISSDPGALDQTLAALITHQGHQQVELWQGLARAGRFRALASQLMARHYDPRYARARSAHNQHRIGAVHTPSLSRKALQVTADQLLALVQNNAARLDQS